MRWFAGGALAGALAAAGHVASWGWPVAWLGVVLLAFVLSRAPTAARRAGAALASGVTGWCVVVGWMLPAFSLWFHWSLARTFPLWLGLVLAMGLSNRLFVAVGALGNWPVRWWLPPCWALGEQLAARGPRLGVGHLLDGQWTVGPVLRAVGWFGWTPVLLVLLFAAASLGEALARRRGWLALPAPVVVVALLLLPPLPADAGALAGLGFVHMPNMDARPATVPPSVDLLVWPEGASRQRPELEEGILDGRAGVGALLGQPTHGHVIGLTGRSRAGFVNAVVLADREGRALAARAKSVLVPATERRFLGVLLSDEPYAPGRIDPYLEAGPHRLVPLVCYEIFDRALVARGVARGGEVLAVISSDRVMRESPVGRQQSLAALVLRAVEHGLPAARAAMWGQAAIVLPDGTVAAQSPPGAGGVLAIEGD